MVSVFVMSDADYTVEIMNGEENVPVPVAELIFYFSEHAIFRACPWPKLFPQLPE